MKIGSCRASAVTDDVSHRQRGEALTTGRTGRLHPHLQRLGCPEVASSKATSAKSRALAYEAASALSQLLASAHSVISTRVADRRLASFCSAEGNSLGSSAPRVAALLAIRRLIAASGSLPFGLVLLRLAHRASPIKILFPYFTCRCPAPSAGKRDQGGPGALVRLWWRL